jgi:hypothetical protein
MPEAPIFYDTGRAYAVLSYLVTALDAAVVAGGGASFPRLVVTTGDPADDDCQCGSLTIAVSQIFPTNSFPRDDSSLKTNCDRAQVALDCTLRVLRCVPSPDDNGRGPTAAELNAAAQITLNDEVLVRHALVCELVALESASPQQIADYLVGATTMTAHSGMCGGFEISFQIGFTADYCGC